MKLQKLEKCRVSEKIKNRINNSIMQPIVFIMFISSVLTKLVVKQVFELPTIYESAKLSASVEACFAGPLSEQILGYWGTNAFALFELQKFTFQKVKAVPAI